MNTTTAPSTTLRTRLIASGAVEQRPVLDPTALDADDPFAGDDILWADEDWTSRTSADDDSSLRFAYGMILALAVSALAWLAVAGSVFLAYRLVA
jgi:hypothetical protein